jgi:hypothetical protein
MAAGRVLAVVLIALVLGLFLNADSLYSRAQALPYGWRRTVAVGVMRPVHAVSSAFRVDRPREWLEEAIGKDTGPTGVGPDVRTPSSALAGGPGGVTPATVTTTTAPPVVLRRPTTAAPLNLWVGGDSMAQVFGESVQRLAVDRGDVNATLDYRISTGLSRPDYFDWPLHLQNDVLPSHPEVVVIIFGANDSQSLSIDGNVHSPSDPEWLAEYRRRAAATMDELRGEGRLVIWVGQPVMRDGGFSARMGALDEIYASEAQSRPWVKFIDTRPLFADASGSYSAYLLGPDGKPVLMRQQDGIHLSRAGGDRLAAAVFATLDDEIDALAGPPPATTTTAPSATTTTHSP